MVNLLFYISNSNPIIILDGFFGSFFDWNEGEVVKFLPLHDLEAVG